MLVNCLSNIKLSLKNYYSNKLGKDVNYNIQVVNYINYVSVRIFGMIDYRKCNVMKHVLFRLIQQDKPVNISFSQLKQIDASVIAILIETISYAKNNNIQLTFDTIKGHTQKVLKLNNVDKIFAKRSHCFNQPSHSEE